MSREHSFADVLRTDVRAVGRLVARSSPEARNRVPLPEMKDECRAHLAISTWLYQQGDLEGGDFEFDAYIACRGWP
jgi:hypothetical protein